jgi:CubicO group peptidase (beta-lactamase class C family)
MSLYRLLVALVLAVPAALPTRAAAQAGCSLAAVDRYLRDELGRQRIPGFSVAVVRDGRLVFARGYGFANLEHRVRATDSTIYQSGSVGKQFTAALVQQLADSGALSLDDPIRRWLPEGPSRWDSVTVRHLLTHTSGIPDYTDSVVDLRREYTEDELVRVAAALPPSFAPGRRWSYSNTGYVLLGAIVRRVTGRFYGDLLHERIFLPLGMRTARIISEADIVPHRSDGYRMVGDSVKHQEWVSPSLNTTADGALYLTVRDLAVWAAALDRGRGLSTADRALAWTPVRLSDGGSYPYGFAWMLDPVRGQPSVYHTGSWQGFRASIARFPGARLTVIVLANLAEAEPRAIGLGVAGILEPSLVPPHRLAAPLPGPRPPVPTDTVLHVLAEDSASALFTPGLRRFLSDDEREEWRGRASKVMSWTPLGCDAAAQPVEELGAEVARWCYARGAGTEGGRVVTMAFTADWRLAAADWYGY